MVGLPYPNMKSAELEEKMKYLDKAVVRHTPTHPPTHTHTHTHTHIDTHAFTGMLAMIGRNSSSDKPPLQFSMFVHTLTLCYIPTYIVYIR